jgi:hypothetical protein
VFTRALLEGLRGPAANDEGYIHTEQLRRFLDWRVPNLHPSSKQLPSFSVNDPIPLIQAPATCQARVTVRLARPKQGLEVFLACNKASPVHRIPLASESEVTFQLDSPRWYNFATAIPRSGRNWVNVLIEGEVAHVDLP